MEATSGSVGVSVDNGVITVTVPESGTGILAANGDSSFGVERVNFGWGDFSGLFVGKGGTDGVTATGSWHYSDSFGVIANGAWKATRTA